MIDHFFERQPYSLDRAEKEALLSQELFSLTEYHYEHCALYKRMLDSMGFDPHTKASYSRLPFLPVSLFKEMGLCSVPADEVVKTMTSSGTTGQAVSRIYLDKVTAALQQKTLVKLTTSFTGTSRMPMLIIDSPSVLKNRMLFSARGAGILGFSILGVDRTYALTEDMKLDVKAVEAFLEKHAGKRILLFGFTFMIWQHFLKELEALDHTFDLSNGIMIHGGGWKKLLHEAVSPDAFKERFAAVCGLTHIHDYYGMVEQTGCIYLECEHGHLHASIFSDVIIRDALDFSMCKPGEKGIIQVVSVLPRSYPGHSLLTEDEGELLGEDDCPCGRKGKYFKVHGRLKNAEIRGCSDTYESKST